MKTVIKAIRGFFKKYHELITLPIAILLWIVSVPVLRAIDPTAATFDAGIFQIPVFSLIQLLLFLSAAWIILKLVFGQFHRFLIFEMKYNFSQLTPWQRIKLAYSIYFLLVAALVLLTRSAV